MDFLLNDEQKLIRQTVRDFVDKEVAPRARHLDEAGEFPWDILHQMGPLGLLGLPIPEAYGGAGFDNLSFALELEELGRGDGSTALITAAHVGLCCGPLSRFGSEAQKQKYLTHLASGKGLGALGLTEPGAGSDLAGGVRTRAERVGNEWVINGSKMWMTNGSVADVIVLLVRTDPKGGTRSLSHIILEKDTPGIHFGPPEKKMGLKGSITNAVTFEDVHVPLDHLLGEDGYGLQQTMEVLDGGRIGIGALALGQAQAAFEHAVHYAKERTAFGRPIADNQAIQWMLADARTEIEAARLLVYKAAWMRDQGQPFSEAASMAKLFATEMAERVCRNAIQIHGGYGYSAEFPVERIYRDTRLMTIGEGTSEIQRLIIARKVLAEGRAAG